MADFTARHKSLAIIPHISASLSILGSLYIIKDVLRSRNKRSSPQHRLLLGMSAADLVASASLFLSTWPIPKGEQAPYGASGNITSCNVQGFMIQVGVACPIYNAFLSIYYLMVVRYGWKDSQFQRIESFCHIVTWSFAFGTGMASLFLKLYNNANLWCWIAPFPFECEDSLRNGGATTCIRGDNAWLYRLVFYYLWLWIAVIIVSVAISLMFWTVYKQAKKNQRFDFHKSAEASSSTSQKHVTRVAVQGILYVGAFYLTATPPSVVRMYQAKWNCTSTFYPLSLTSTIVFPLQGMWNFIIYIRPKMNRYWKKTGGCFRFISFDKLFNSSIVFKNGNKSNLSSQTSELKYTNHDLTERNNSNRNFQNCDSAQNCSELYNSKAFRVQKFMKDQINKETHDGNQMTERPPVSTEFLKSELQDRLEENPCDEEIETKKSSHQEQQPNVCPVNFSEKQSYNLNSNNATCKDGTESTISTDEMGENLGLSDHVED